MRERLAYMIMIGMLIVLVVFIFAVVGRGEYQPPPEEREQGSIRSEALSRDHPSTEIDPLLEMILPRTEPLRSGVSSPRV